MRQRVRQTTPGRIAAFAAVVVVAAAVGVAVARVTSRSSPRSTNSPRAAGAIAPRVPTGLVAPAARQPATVSDDPDLPRLVGQLIVGRYVGPNPSADFLARVRAGRLGAVILFSDNTAAGLSATRGAIAELQAAARQGGNPPLLIMTDQEGGEVRRLSGPPELAAAQMDSPAVAHSQGVAAGKLLRSVGINVDLAPVADVERVPDSFLGSRSFGSDPRLVATRACAFAAGLESAGVAYTLKHFPGLGRATASTDLQPVTIPAAAADLRADYAAYRKCGSSPDALVMVSSAIYPALSGSEPAVMSRRIYTHELPLALGRADHLTISDALDTPAFAGLPEPAVPAVRAGLDLAMFPGNEAESATPYEELLAAARSGSLPPGRVRDAARAVEALKRRVAR